MLMASDSYVFSRDYPVLDSSICIYIYNVKGDQYHMYSFMSVDYREGQYKKRTLEEIPILYVCIYFFATFLLRVYKNLMFNVEHMR